jgi:diguanylate cyclase (GGDEF)-like protein
MHPLTAPGLWRKSVSISLGFLLIAVIGVLDYFTSYELSFSTFYLIPLFLLAWTTWTWMALAGSVACALVWSLADVLSGHVYPSPLFLYWNVGVRLVLFVIMAWVLSALKRSTEREKALARIDPLTGAANTRSFMEVLALEIERSVRYGKTFTVAYLDLDNFKAVNDSLGHASGDRVLQTVVAAIRGQMRSSDSIARLGGDEFALLLPETEEEAARAAIGKIHACILGEMQRNGWPVTVSIGAFAWDGDCRDANELVTLADKLMYRAKKGGKNAVAFPDPPTP